EAINAVLQGKADNLGGGVYKKRLNQNRDRAIVLAKGGEHWFYINSGKPVFAICHGPQLLISADVIRGRKLTAVKPIIIDVKNAGA
ncbi:DJ-1/PfpI family protein, partial [Salmonella enterica subsp. enterica serovar Anatum]|nr:DJ-1/PfpI family protein [Salmonella enterica subsp. enterica serovar Anatum]